MPRLFLLLSTLAVALFFTTFPVAAQLPGQQLGQARPATPQVYEVLGLSVAGTEDENTRRFVLQVSGLEVGQRVQMPVDDGIAEAVRKLYQAGSFSNVEVLAENIVGEGIFLLIRVEEQPRLASIQFEGVKRGQRDDLEETVPLLRGRPVRPADLARTEQAIINYFRDEGYLLATVDHTVSVNDNGRADVVFNVDRGRKVEVENISFVGNDSFSERTLRKRLKNTPEDRWWRFWSGESFVAQDFEEDLQTLVDWYQDEGYYGARVLQDSVWVEGEAQGEPEVHIQIKVEEGPLYVIRDVSFEGNTEYTDAQLRTALGFEVGEPYSKKKFEQNLYYNPDHSDIASLYTDRGYLRFNAIPTITTTQGDSLDIAFLINEGDIYEFGQITIAGNTKTKEHVVRRELRTIPGQTYSRQAIERSVRELVTLNYFAQEELAGGPSIEIDEETRTVGLTYNLTEAGGDQLELSGGWGGFTGLLLQAGVRFNNFSIQNLFDGSAWRPVPSGDGQTLALQVQTNGRFYQNYSLSFTEPWFRGRPNPVGFSLGYTYNGLRSRFVSDQVGEGDSFQLVSARVFNRFRLKWPDDFFQTGTDLSYRLYNINGQGFSNAFGLPVGVSQELNVRQSLTRNSLNNPIFPSAGSSFLFSAEAALPLPGFIQYHKWRLSNDWYLPIFGRLSFGAKADYGYIGSLTGDEVEFQRYLLGGSPLDAQGNFIGFGKDVLFMRGYPLGVISPRQDGEAVGGRIFNQYSAEIQLLAVQSPQLQFAPYLFADAGNAWDSFDTYSPSRLFRSAGFGAKIFLPILGLVDLNYGYQIDPFVPRNSTDTGLPQWRFQFSLGGQ
ncbi:MAG: outer membrane protein assembly factor BamA [Bacteroidota bacterium]